MGKYVPVSGTEIQVDGLYEKTAAAGITAFDRLKSDELYEASSLAGVDINGAILAKLAETLLKSGGTTRLTLDAAGALFPRLGHSGYTSGGEIKLFTAACNTTSTTPVTLFTYTIGATNTQVAFFIFLMSRNNSSNASCSELYLATANRAGAGAVAGVFSTPGAEATAGTHMTDLAQSVASNTVTFTAANDSGTDTLSHVAFVLAIPVSTST